MKITVLADNNTMIDRYFEGEPGVSYFIEDENIKILFDLGYSDVFIRNAVKLDIPVIEADYVVLSHGHNDHTWGLMSYLKIKSELYFEKKKKKAQVLLAHPHALEQKIYEGVEIGNVIDPVRLEHFFEVKLTTSPVWITNRLVFLGEIPRNNSFEAKRGIGNKIVNKEMTTDYLLDDTALVYKGNDGLVIITGCSHSGICNIIDAAVSVCKEEKIQEIIGGFHLLNPESSVLEKTVHGLKMRKVTHAYPCHCTDLRSKIEISKQISIDELGSGSVLEYN